MFYAKRGRGPIVSSSGGGSGFFCWKASYPILPWTHGSGYGLNIDYNRDRGTTKQILIENVSRTKAWVADPDPML